MTTLGSPLSWPASRSVYSISGIRMPMSHRRPETVDAITPAFGDDDVSDGARLRTAQHGRPGRPHRLVDRNLHAQRFRVARPVARVGVRARRIPGIRRAAIEDARGLEDQPRGKLGAVPRPF